MIRRLFKRSSLPPATYDDPNWPVDRLVSILMESARINGATAFVFGMPRELPASVGTRYESEFKKSLMGGDVSPTVHRDDDASRAFASISHFKCAAGWKTIPMWQKVNGQLYGMPASPVALLLTILDRFEKRLLSLDASEACPKPMRYIEYRSENPAERCFAEVELYWDEDNTFRVEIMRHLRMPASVRAVPFVT